jgi:hypothetical protein
LIFFGLQMLKKLFGACAHVLMHISSYSFGEYINIVAEYNILLAVLRVHDYNSLIKVDGTRAHEERRAPRALRRAPGLYPSPPPSSWWWAPELV